MSRIVWLAWIGMIAGAGQAQPSWRLEWADEFDGPANSAPDPSKWTRDLGQSGWGNKELENYTNSTENAFLDGAGHLVIQAMRAGEGGYTSARLKTQGLASFTYGRIEARMRIPYGQGIWPAFWMLGEDIKTNGWPRSGEIDIMENIGKEPATVHGTVHGPGYSGGKGIGRPYQLAAGRFADAFHVYAVIWEREQHRVSGGRAVLQAGHARRSAAGRQMGVRPSVFSAAERGGGRELAGQSRCHHGISAAHDGGLRARVQPAVGPLGYPEIS